MRGRLGVWIAAPVLVLMAAFIFVLATSDPSGERNTGSKLLGRQAPPIVGTTVDGGEFVLADHQGEWVLVNMFATWCTPCKVEHPELVRFSERHQRLGDATVVSVVFDDKVANVRAFLDDNGGDWPVVADPDGQIAISYAVAQVPESYLVAPDGTVALKFTGGVTAAGLDRALTDAQERTG